MTSTVGGGGQRSASNRSRATSGCEPRYCGPKTHIRPHLHLGLGSNISQLVSLFLASKWLDSTYWCSSNNPSSLPPIFSRFIKSGKGPYQTEEPTSLYQGNVTYFVQGIRKNGILWFRRFGLGVVQKNWFFSRERKGTKRGRRGVLEEAGRTVTASNAGN